MLMSHNEDFHTKRQDMAKQKEIIGPVAGGVLIALALSGLLDDTGVLPHPWWAVLLASVAIVGLLVGARTVKILLYPGAGV